MSQNTSNSKPTHTAFNVAVRDLIAAMPIVILANAVLAAFQRQTPSRESLRTAQTN